MNGRGFFIRTSFPLPQNVPEIMIEGSTLTLESEDCLMRKLPPSAFVLLALAMIAAPLQAQAPAAKPKEKPRYEVRKIHDPNGIGKFYLGREIAMVMGHQGIGWLE